MYLEAGQKISVDVSGMRVTGALPDELYAQGIVVDVAPGVITVRVELDNGKHLDVTVSPGRIGR